MAHIDELVKQMTLEEKISVLAGADLWNTIGVPRLGIPAIKVTDGPNGARGAGGNLGPSSALFPVGTALGATWNPELIEQVGAALAAEVKAKGAHVLLGPTVNIHRTPLAGTKLRIFFRRSIPERKDGRGIYPRSSEERRRRMHQALRMQ
jgi:beta-glucosidase